MADDVGGALTGLSQWLGLTRPPEQFSRDDEAFRNKLLELALPEQKKAIDETQADLWRAQMDQQTPLATRNWKNKVAPMSTEEPARYGGMDTVAPIRIPRDPLNPRLTPFGNDEYPLDEMDTGRARYKYGKDKS